MFFVFFLRIRRPPRSTQSRSSAASDVYKRQPRTRLAEMVDRIDAIAARHNVVCATFGHAGDGNLHPTIVFDPADGDVRHRAEAAFSDVFDTAIELGGTITGEHGVGAAKRPYLERRLGADQMALLRRLKAAFDPAGILNPGKLGS